MVSRPTLALAVAAWTLLTWGGRIRLLTAAEQSDPANWARIGGSLLLGAAVVVVLFLAPGGSLERWVLTAFAGWSVLLWARSLAVVLPAEHSTAFKAVHTLLALGFFLLAYWALRWGWSPRRG